MDGTEAMKKAYLAILRSDFEQAIGWFEEAIALEPGNAAYHYRLSITCARSNRLQAALTHAEKAIALAPDDPSYRFHLDNLRAKERVAEVKALLDQGGSQLYLAHALLKEAVLLDPLSIEARFLLGVVSGELGEYQEAIASLKETARLSPHYEGVHKLLEDYERKLRQTLSGKSGSS